MATSRVSQPPPAADAQPPPPLTVSAVVDDALWSLFTRADDGWTGGDGTNSIPLPDGRVLWTFWDTFLGPVNADRTRPKTAPLIHNSLVVQNGDSLTTLHGGSRRAPRALFSPTDGASWYWLGDGTAEGDTLRLFLLRFLRHGPEGWAWRWVGTDLASLRLPDLTVRTIAPLPVKTGIRYGAAILEAQDYTYIYGVEDMTAAKYGHVARARRDALLGPWEFFDGRSWVTSPATTARILDASIGTEFSVIAVEGGYALITIETSRPLWEWGEIVAFFAPDPTGPWTDRTILYTTPETGRDNLFVYNAHAHPHLSRGGDLLVSYNVNSFQFEDLYANVDRYRARFIRVALPVPPS